ncbi:lamin tail domain-containing protein [Candidatus Roizmanbacteria bacterium]|nr:lamin tail domain-containing protein [Candidatus Roizmanbacteria bacterium]
MKRLLIKLSLLFFLIIFWRSPLTSSNYYDTETSSGNTISAGHWDTTAPIISSVSHLIATSLESNDTKATISWITNESADSNLYWTTDNIIWNIVSDSSFATNHSLEIFGLSTDTAYYYYVTSSDRAGNTTASTTNNFSTDGMPPESYTPTTDVVINEFLPNPTGDDPAPKPGGEWIELYNKSLTDSYDLTNWYLTNSNSSQILNITTSNTASSDKTTSGLMIGPNEFFVVYRDGDSDFSLDDNVDELNLFDNGDNRVDQFSYDTSLGDVILENKSIARYPDGSGIWFDPIPSPLGANILEDWQLNKPEIKYTFDGQRLSFEVLNVDKYKQIEYQLTYDSDSGEQGVIGTNQLSNQSSYKKEAIIFGTCSTGGTCIYHFNLSNIILKIIITNDSEVINLEKIIN